MRTNIWSKDRLYIDVQVLESGDLEVKGHDLSGPGDSEYEYWIQVPAADLPALTASLGGAEADDVVASSQRMPP